MSYISKIGKSLLPLALAAGSFTANAQDDLPEGQSWRRIYFLDFGGNSTSDDIYRGAPLTQAEGFSSIDFAPVIGAGTVYTIGKYAPVGNLAKGWLTNAGDHTYADDSNKGYFLMLNCPQKLNYPKDVMYEKTLTSALCSGVTFKFQAFVANMEAKCTADKGVNFITVGIYDANDEKLWQQTALKLGSGSVTASGSLAWEEISGTFSIPKNADLSAIKFKIYPMLDGTPGATSGGYDIGLDDIAIYVAQPSLEFTSTEFLYQEGGKISATLSNTAYFNSMNDVAYRWEYSPDNGETTSWVKVAEGKWADNKTFDYKISSFNKDNKDGTGNGYYRLTLATAENLANIDPQEEATTKVEPVCAVRGTFQINETKNKMKLLLCDGESYVVDGKTISKAGVITTDNNYEVTTEVIVNRDSTGKLTQICVGQEYPVNSGNIYTEIGTFDLNSIPVKSYRKSANGNSCDSVTISQKVEVTDGIYVNNDFEHVCSGKMSVDGVLRTTVGTFIDTVHMGCVHNINTVVVHPIYDEELEKTICEGSVYDGKTYNEGGIYNLPAKTYKSAFGCDSVVTMKLTVTSHTEATLPDVELCQSDFGDNEPAFTFDGKKYTNTTKKDMVLDLEEVTTSKSTGCDSITKVHVVIHPMVHVQNDTLICRDQKLFGKIWSVAGNYDYDFRYETSNGCDSVVTWHIKVLDIQLKLRAEDNRSSVCLGNSASLIVDLVPSNVPLTWEPELASTNPLHPSVQPEETTVYTAHARNSVGCHATDTITISVNPTPSLSIDTVILEDRKMVINYFGGTPEYLFEILSKTGGTIGSGDFRTVSEDNTIDNLNRGSYILRLHDSNNCVADAPFSLEATPIYPASIFSPNGDGINDVWIIDGIEAYNNTDNGKVPSLVRIYDRTGRKVFETRGYNNADNAFTGEYNGNLLPSTDYWYCIDLEMNDVQYVGHFTLLR